MIKIDYIELIVPGICLFISCFIATYWLISEENMKTYTINGEFTVTREIMTVEASSESEAIEKAQAAAKTIAHDLGIDGPEILWAEEA